MPWMLVWSDAMPCALRCILIWPWSAARLPLLHLSTSAHDTKKMQEDAAQPRVKRPADANHRLYHSQHAGASATLLDKPIILLHITNPPTNLPLECHSDSCRLPLCESSLHFLMIPTDYLNCFGTTMGDELPASLYA